MFNIFFLKVIQGRRLRIIETSFSRAKRIYHANIFGTNILFIYKTICIIVSFESRFEVSEFLIFFFCFNDSHKEINCKNSKNRKFLRIKHHQYFPSII